MRRLLPLLLLLLPLCLGTWCNPLWADPVPVKYREGTVHGYLSVRSLDGKMLGSADLIQRVEGDVLTAHLIYRFRDGSIDDDTAVFSQHANFRLISDHHIQKGPIFKVPVDMTVIAGTGEVTVRSMEKGREKTETTHLDLPPDLANGMILVILKNISPRTAETKVGYVVSTPKPRLVTLSITPEGTNSFTSAGVRNKAMRFNIHLKLGGLAGLVAPVVGKEPPDAKAWVSVGEVPAFIRSEQPLFLDGPVLRTELVSPVMRIPRTAEPDPKGR